MVERSAPIATSVAELRESLIVERFDDVYAFFAANAVDRPVVAWSPTPETIGHSGLIQLLNYWREKRGERPAPRPSEIDPLEMRFILGYAMLLEVLDDGADFRYRLFGSGIAERFGAEMTGKRLSDMQSGEYIFSFFAAGYQAVVARGEPMFTEHYPSLRSEVSNWKRLILPLQNAEGRTVRLLVGQIPGPWRPRRP